jgi:hypothetical protein
LGVSSHLVARENVPEPAQILIGATSPGGVADALQQSWRDGTLAEYVLFPVLNATRLDGFEDFDLAQLTVITRPIVPFGGLVRGRLAAGETVIVNGATGAMERCGPGGSCYGRGPRGRGSINPKVFSLTDLPQANRVCRKPKA